jgi:RimJ/RimL family protein N-acetyltransferase
MLVLAFENEMNIISIFVPIPKGQIMYFAQSQGKFVCQLILDEIKSQQPIIIDVKTEDGHKRKGYAKSLMRKVLEDCASKLTKTEVVLDCHRDNYAARKLYESLGFRYVDNGPACIRMKKTLL